MVAQSSKDLVIGIDSSTTATKAIAWTADGTAVAEGRSRLPLDSPCPGHYEQPAETWWRSLCEALKEVVGRVDPGRIAALSIANQRETFVPLDADGRPLRAAIVWLDERCRAEVPELAAAVGAETIHRITGKPPDITPVAYRLAWLRRHEPEVLDRTAMLADVHGYLTWRLTGRFATSQASADPLGLYDMAGRHWSPTLLDALGLSLACLPEAAPPGTVLGRMTEAAAEATGLAAGTPVVAGGGDGQAAGLGVGALSPELAYLNLGTACVSGVFSPDYRTDPAWRTMGSLTGAGYYLETCLRTGTFLIDWYLRRLCRLDPDADPGLYTRLEDEAAALPIGAGGLLLVPYWSGAMNPYWDIDARGALVGLNGQHGQAHVYRALMEGVALEQAMATADLERRAGLELRDYVAIGGGAQSDLWCALVANASGKRVRRSATVEASSLGAAITAAVGAGLYDSAETAARAMTGAITATFAPDPDAQARYAELLTIYRRVYPSLRAVYAELARFREAPA